MSLTSHIKDQDVIYHSILQQLDFDTVREVIFHQNKMLASMKLPPVKGTEFMLSGMSVIYALRDYFGGESIWKDTLAGEVYPYPHYCERPARWVCMGLMDDYARKVGRFGKTPDKKSFVPKFKPTIKDVAQIANSFKYVIGPPRRFIMNKGNSIKVNPYFAGSYDVGGADANFLLGNTLMDIRTTAKKYPCQIADVVKQVGYYLLDYENEYNIEYISWYYTRQECYFTHPIDIFLKDKAYLDNNRGPHLLNPVNNPAKTSKSYLLMDGR